MSQYYQIRCEFFSEANEDFVKLTESLDAELRQKNGDSQNKFDKFNRLDGIHDIVLGYCDDVPVACAAMKKISLDCFEIKRVFVQRGFRNLGLARKMMDVLETKAQQKGVKTLILETSKTFTPAIKLYTSLGYHEIARYAQYRDMEESYCMEKTIT